MIPAVGSMVGSWLVRWMACMRYTICYEQWCTLGSLNMFAPPTFQRGWSAGQVFIFNLILRFSFAFHFHVVFILSCHLKSLVRSFIHSFVRSFVRSFIRSFIHPVSHLCTDSFMSLISCSFISILVSVLSFADALHKFNKDRRSYKPWVDCSPYFFRSFLLGMAGHHQNLVWHVSPCLDPTCVYIYLFIYVFICFFLYLFNDFYDNLYVYIQICFPHTLYIHIYIYIILYSTCISIFYV